MFGLRLKLTLVQRFQRKTITAELCMFVCVDLCGYTVCLNLAKQAYCTDV